jgi:hypothetical protein
MTEYPNIEMRTSVTERIEALASAIRKLDGAIKQTNDAAKFIDVAWENFGASLVTSIIYAEKADAAKGIAILGKLVRETVMSDLYAAVEQLASLLVRDVIAIAARTSDEPIAWLTGNAYMPPLRDIGEAETVYQNDPDGTVWEAFMESLDRHLGEANVLMECPEYDNALYVVDLTRWQHREEDEIEDTESLNGEWIAVPAVQ